MLIREYRVVLPLTVEEYQIWQLYTIAMCSKAESGGGEGIEILKNETFDDYPAFEGKYKKGQYTYKIYHVASKAPPIIRLLTPKTALEVHEEAWNAFPYCKTVLTNPNYHSDKLYVTIESLHLADDGTSENVLKLPPDKLKIREVVLIDISNSPMAPADYKEDEDPALFKSTKTGRGPLVGNWIPQARPVMTCYKLVTVEFKWFGLQTRIENVVQKQEQRIFTIFHRRLFCWMDKWFGLTMREIRALEEGIREELDKLRSIPSPA